MIIDFPTLTVEIESAVLNRLKYYEQTDDKNESGGILLGKYCPEYEHYLITAITEPTSKDSSGRLWFNRNCNSAQEIINKKWEETDGLVNYLGEWHTHPWKYPKPSFTDKILMHNIFHDGSNVWKHLFMIIIGLNDTFYIGVYNAANKGRIEYEKIIGE